MLEKINKFKNLFIKHKFINIDRNSIHYFKLLMEEVRNEKTFINKVYNIMYDKFIHIIEKYKFDMSGKIIEIGSGYAFFKEYCKQKNIEITRTDVVLHGNTDMIVNAEFMPFEDKSVSIIFMFGVLHHIKNSHNFFREAERVLKSNGAIIMIEPTANRYAEFLYKISHSEPFDKNIKEWIIHGDDPMTCANLALPDVIFERDLNIFKKSFPQLELIKKENHTPFLFQFSGAGPFKPPLGELSFYFFRLIERIFMKYNSEIGMFSSIVIRRI